MCLISYVLECKITKSNGKTLTKNQKVNLSKMCLNLDSTRLLNTLNEYNEVHPNKNMYTCIFYAQIKIWKC